MVCEWGMSDAMGPLTFGKKEEQIFLGREIAQHQDYSEDTALKIDAEVKRFVMDAYDARRDARPSTRSALLEIADALLAREVLDADQVRRLARGQPLEDAPAARRRRAGRRRRDRARDGEGAAADRAADAKPIPGIEAAPTLPRTTRDRRPAVPGDRP